MPRTATPAQKPQPGPRPRQPASPPGLMYTILRHTRGLSHEDTARQVEEAARTAPLAA